MSGAPNQPAALAANTLPANSANKFLMLVAGDNDVQVSLPVGVSSSAAAL